MLVRTDIVAQAGVCMAIVSETMSELLHKIFVDFWRKELKSKEDLIVVLMARRLVSLPEGSHEQRHRRFRFISILVGEKF